MSRTPGQFCRWIKGHFSLLMEWVGKGVLHAWCYTKWITFPSTSWSNNQICIHHWASSQTMAAASVEATPLLIWPEPTTFPQFRKSGRNRIMASGCVGHWFLTVWDLWPFWYYVFYIEKSVNIMISMYQNVKTEPESLSHAHSTAERLLWRNQSITMCGRNRLVD